MASSVTAKAICDCTALGGGAAAAAGCGIAGAAGWAGAESALKNCGAGAAAGAIAAAGAAGAGAGATFSDLSDSLVARAHSEDAGSPDSTPQADNNPTRVAATMEANTRWKCLYI